MRRRATSCALCDGRRAARKIFDRQHVVAATPHLYGLKPSEQERVSAALEEVETLQVGKSADGQMGITSSRASKGIGCRS